MGKKISKTKDQLIKELEETRGELRKLEESRIRFSSVFEYSNDAIFLIDPDTNAIINANPRACEMLGYSREELLELPISAVHPHEMTELLEFAHSVAEDGSGWSDSFTCLTKSKETCYVEMSATMVSANGGQHMLTMVRDVTKNKKANEELAAMASFAELNPAPVVRLDLKGSIIQANQAALEFFEMEELVGYEWVEIVPDVDKKALEKLVERGGMLRHELERDDKSLLFHYRGVPELESVHVYAFDITDRKKAEIALMESEARFRGLLTSAPDAVVITNKDGNIILSNEQTEKIFGYTQEEILEKPIEFLMPGRFDAKHKKLRLAYYADPTTRTMGTRMDYFGQRKNGEEFPIENSMSPLKEEGGFLVMNIIRDITEHKQSQKTLQDINESLELRVKERTQELSDSLGKLELTLNNSIDAMAKIVEIRDPYTAGHQARVAQLAQEIAIKMGLNDECVAGIHRTGLIHDIGKIYVPAEILAKPGSLTDKEFAIIQEHVQVGADIVGMIDFPWPVSDVILQHHERLDGSGYPNGLKGDEILLEAKILAVADVVEAMSVHRPYRPSLGIDKALEEIEKNSRILYDPRAVQTCLDLFRELNFEFDK